FIAIAPCVFGVGAAWVGDDAPMLDARRAAASAPVVRNCRRALPAAVSCDMDAPGQPVRAWRLDERLERACRLHGGDRGRIERRPGCGPGHVRNKQSVVAIMLR